MTASKTIVSVLSAPSPHWVGDGFPVRTIFSVHGQDPSALSPFLLLDYAGPKEFPPTPAGQAPRPRGVDEHPHRGFETVTIVYQGELEHRDSSGNRGRIGPGDVQWMTAASGVVHEEKHATEFTKRGGTLEMIQLWVNLPAREKMSKPRYQEILDKSIPVVNLAENAGIVRVIAGEFPVGSGKRGPATTVTPLNVWDMRITGGHRASFALPPDTNSFIVVLHGQVTVVGSDALSPHACAVLSREGETIDVQALADATILVLNGQPIDEPVVAHGPFVMNTLVEIKQAVLDYQSGRMGRLEPVA